MSNLLTEGMVYRGVYVPAKDSQDGETPSTIEVHHVPSLRGYLVVNRWGYDCLDLLVAPTDRDIAIEYAVHTCNEFRERRKTQ